MNWAVIGAVLATVLLVVVLNRKLTKDVRDKLQFAIVSFLAVVAITRAITQSIPTHAWLRMGMLVLLLTAMWLAAWQDRRTGKDNLNSRIAVLAGYMAVHILEYPDILLRH